MAHAGLRKWPTYHRGLARCGLLQGRCGPSCQKIDELAQLQTVSVRQPQVVKPRTQALIATGSTTIGKRAWENLHFVWRNKGLRFDLLRFRKSFAFWSWSTGTCDPASILKIICTIVVVCSLVGTFVMFYEEDTSPLPG